MTREEKADILSNEAAPALVNPDTVNRTTRECLRLAVIDAAAELRKTCATCRHFCDLFITEAARCDWGREAGVCPIFVPVDGSGFCHRWEPKPTPEAKQ